MVTLPLAKILQQKRVYPYPLGAGSARPNPKMGAPDPENPLFLGFSVLRGGLRPWSRKGPDPSGGGRDPETVKTTIRSKMITDPLKLFQNYLDNYCNRTVTDFNFWEFITDYRYRLRDSRDVFS